MLKNVSSLKYKKTLCGFPEDKNYNKKKNFINDFHKKLLKVIRKKAMSIRKSQFADPYISIGKSRYADP